MDLYTILIFAACVQGLTIILLPAALLYWSRRFAALMKHVEQKDGSPDSRVETDLK